MEGSRRNVQEWEGRMDGWMETPGPEVEEKAPDGPGPSLESLKFEFSDPKQ